VLHKPLAHICRRLRVHVAIATIGKGSDRFEEANSLRTHSYPTSGASALSLAFQDIQR
jgi:hypothetical protein